MKYFLRMLVPRDIPRGRGEQRNVLECVTSYDWKQDACPDGNFRKSFSAHPRRVCTHWIKRRAARGFRARALCLSLSLALSLALSFALSLSPLLSSQKCSLQAERPAWSFARARCTQWSWLHLCHRDHWPPSVTTSAGLDNSGVEAWRLRHDLAGNRTTDIALWLCWSLDCIPIRDGVDGLYLIACSV